MTMDGTAGDRHDPRDGVLRRPRAQLGPVHLTSTSGGAVSITGHGWGHGIGMGQWGALGYAIGQDNGDGNWTYGRS